MLVEMCFRHPVIIQPQPLTQGILRDFEPSIGIPTQRRGKEKMDRQREARLPQGLSQSITMGRLGKRNENLLPDEFLVRASLGGEQAAAIDGGILMIHAGRNGQGQPDRFSCDPHSWSLGRELQQGVPASGGRT